MTVIMYTVKREERQENQDESEQGTGRQEPGSDRRGRSPVIPRAGLRRDRRRGSHEGGGPHAWRFLRTLLLEGRPDRGGVCPRVRGLACGVEQPRGACAG